MKRVFGLIGYPLTHSFSKSYFNTKFKLEGIDAVYENFPLAGIGEFPALIQHKSGLAGLNVTIPYKEVVIPFLDELDKDAAAIAAVNVIEVEHRNGKIRLIGHNSDYIGFKDSILPEIERLRSANSEELKALILGTGGASKAVYYALSQLGIQSCFVSRDAKKARYTYSDLDSERIKSHQIIVNTTPLGMTPNVESYPELPYQALGPGHLLYDLVYNPSLTRFLYLGKQQGARTVNGENMLELQAEAAWRIWNKQSETK